MSGRQGHGNDFEDYIAGSGRFPGAENRETSPTAEFDIDAQYDGNLHLMTSVKVTGSNTIFLADARRFWEIFEPFRLVVGCYDGTASAKNVTEIHEFIVDMDMMEVLRGEIPLSDVEAIHTGMQFEHFGRGEYRDARLWARAQVKAEEEQRGLVTLNPKIDSKTQRRLQCSVSLTALQRLADQKGGFTITGPLQRGTSRHQNFHEVYKAGSDKKFGDITLPLKL